MIRCVKCGCSRLDSENVGCVLCGGSPSVRWEQCHVSAGTRVELSMQRKELERFGIGVEIQKGLAKLMGAPKGFVVVLTVGDYLHRTVLRALVSFLRENGVSAEDILRLRLDEPEAIIACY